MAQGVFLAGPEADIVAEGGAGQACLAVPHDLMSGVGGVFSVAVAAEVGDEGDGVAEASGRAEVVDVCVVAQEGEFGVGEHELRRAVEDLASEQGHDHDAPCDDGVDGDGVLQAFGGAEQQVFDPAAGLEHPKEVLDLPALERETDDLGGVPGGADGDGGEQEPLDRILALGRRGLPDVDAMEAERLCVAGGTRCRQGDAPKAQLAACQAFLARRAGVCPTGFGAFGEALDLDVDETLAGAAGECREQLRLPLCENSVMPGADQQVDTRRVALGVEECEEVGFPVAYRDDMGLACDLAGGVDAIPLAFVENDRNMRELDMLKSTASG